MAKTKKTEEERERERREREAQRRNSAYQSNEKRIRNSAVLGGYQASGNSRGTSSNASQKTSSATLQRPSERRQIPSLQKTASRSEQRRNYQEENARNAQRNIQKDNRRFSTGKELKTAKENMEKTRRMSEGTLSSSNGTFKESNADWIDTSRKNSIADTAMEGFSRGVVSLPLALTKLADRITGNKTAIENEKRREDRSRQAMEDHPLAYTGGNLAGNLLTQNMVRGIVNDAVGSTAWTDTARQAASDALSNGATGRQALATGLRAAAPDFAKNLAQQTAVDTVAETLPSIMNDIADQKSGREVLGNAGKNIAQNAAFNALMEIPGLAGVARGTGAEARNLANALQNPSMVSDAPRPDLPALTPFGEGAEQTAIPIERAIPEYKPRYAYDGDPRFFDSKPFRERVATLPESPMKQQLKRLLDETETAYAHTADASNIDNMIDSAFGSGWEQTVHAAGGDLDFKALRDRLDDIPDKALRKQYQSVINASEEAVRIGRINDAREALNTVFNDENWTRATVPKFDLGLSEIKSDSVQYSEAVEATNAFDEAMRKFRNGEISKDELNSSRKNAKNAMGRLSTQLKREALAADPVAQEAITNSNLVISDIKKALGKKNGTGEATALLTKKQVASYRSYKGEKINSIINRLNHSVEGTNITFRVAGKNEVPNFDPALMERLTDASKALAGAQKDSGLGNYDEAIYNAYRQTLDSVGNTAGDVQNDDAIQAIGEMAARETEAPQLPRLEQTARQAQDQIPGMDNVNGRVDNVNEVVDGGTGRTDIPGMEDNAGRTKTSQTYTNTGKYGGGWNEAEYKAYTDAQNYQYETVSEKESVERAWQTIREEGADNAKERLLNTDNLSGSDLDALMSLWRVQVSNARAAEALGENADEMWKESNRIFKKIQTESTHNAQALQALAKWSRNTPEGMLSRVDAIINGRTGGTDAASASMEKVYNKYFKDKGKIELSEDFQKNFLDLAERYQGATGREREELMAEMGKLINKQIPVKLPEKIKTYLMDSMLGNFRTLITRNAGGNIGFNAVEQTAERPLAALVDSIIGKKTGRRTQAGLSKEALADYMSGFGKGLSDEWKDFQKTLSGGAGSSLHTARSGESTLEEAIANNRQVFSSFIGDKADQLVKHGLSVGDRPFYEAVYKETLGDYNRMYKAGQMGADVQSLDPETFKEYAEAAAKMNALSACYQDDSALAKGFMDLRNGVAGLSKGVTGVDILSQFAMPFVKTPANIISRAVEYSPLGFIKNAVNTGRDMAANAAREGGVGGLAGLNAAQQNRLANETARNILGTGLFAGGYAAAKSGLISGGYSDDKDEAAIQRANGMQEYALHTGDDYRSIDWVPVLGNNLVAASAFQEAVENNNGNAVDNFGAGLTAGLESQFDTSMLQGLQSLFGSDAYDRNAGIIANVENTVKSGATQAIPSIIRQAAAFDDPYKRQLSGANPDDYYINNMAYSIPGIRRGLEPKINNQGEALEQNAGRNTLQKFYDNFISPYSTTTETHTPLDDEAMRLSQSIGSDIAFVTSPSRKDITTESYTPTDAEYTNYQRDAGRLKKEIGEGLLQSDFYKQLNDTDKAETLSDVYTAAKAIAREPFTGADPDDRYAKVYKADGLEGVLSYINANINSKKVNFDAEGKGKGLTSANARGKFDAISTTGLTAEEQGKIYYNTLSASEQEKLSDFYSSTGDAGMYQLLRGKALANEDGNGSVKIQEVLDYATSFPEVSEAVVNQLASSATGTFKKEDGVWNYYNKKGKLTKQGEKKQYNYTAPKIDYGEAKTEESSGTQNNSGSLTVNAAESSRYSVSSVSSKDSKKDTYKLTDKQLNSASYGRYQELSKALPDYKISNKDYDDMYKAIDADSNESLKKAEITAYLDSRDDLSAEEKSALFSVYGHSNWKNPYAGGSKTAGSGSGKSSGKKGSGKGSSRKSKKIAFQSYERMNIPSLRQLDSGRASLRSLSGGGGGGNVIPGLNLSNINLGGSGSIPSIASLMNRYQNMYR